MKLALKSAVVTLLCIIVGLPLLVGFLYAKNGYVGVKADVSQSPDLKTKPAPWTQSLVCKIVTFNIQDLWVVGQNRPERMRHIAQVLTELDPDIVGFQEAFIDKDRELLLKSLLTTRLRYHQYFPSGLVGSGVLICSTWPIKEVFFHRYQASAPAKRIWEGDFWAGKGAGMARIETPAGLLDFYNTHAQAGYGRTEYREVRRQQMIELAGFINESRVGTIPAFLVGDLNCGIGAVDYETVVNQAGLIRTMSINSHIDHILAVQDSNYLFETLETVPIEKRVTEGGRAFSLSDHSGYMSTIRIQPRTAK